MVIGIDIDETITNTHDEALKYVKKYAPNLEFNDYCDDIKNKDVKAFLEKHAYNIQSNLTLKPYVKEAFSMFKEHGFKIVIITARGYDLNYEYERASIDMLKKYDLPYDEIYYKQNKKGKIAKELNVSYFIDDKEKVLDEVKEHGIQTIWYTNEKKESKHLIFSNWLDIANYIIERSN